ncbi:F0F1 ATP synthase subunit gamma [Patescibacteria group bacterium]|nr:F0F1 ATP synthase subunit gamma [Patescibacteria group bacterium]
MKRIKYLKDELDYLSSFLTMVEAYEEIAALRMRKVKKFILERREFMKGLNEAFAYISYAYRVYRKSLKGKERDRILNTNGKTVYILLSSNTGMYGDIIINTFNLFLDDLKKEDADVVIVGKVGQRMYDNLGDGREYEYFEMFDNGIDEPGIKKLIEHVTNYSNVVVYHGSFKSVLSQVATRTEVPVELKRIEQSLKTYDDKFLFEPSVEKVAEHFEKQIESLIFEQVVFESCLSKFASRMVNMDIASDNIGEKIRHTNIDMKKAKHKDLNSSMQSVIFGGSLWK